MRQRLAVVLLAALLLAASGTDDPLAEQQWHLGVIRAPEAWTLSRGEGTIVAVLDTGVSSTHPDLVGRLLPGTDLLDPGTPPDDENGHGTLVAGVVAAVADNHEGVVGAAPETSLLPVRVLGPDGMGDGATVAAGIRWAVDNGADVINLSLADTPIGTPEPSLSPSPLPLPMPMPGAFPVQVRQVPMVGEEVVSAIREADARGVVVVAAAGNGGRNTTPYAADVPVLVVGATDRDDVVWTASNRDARTVFAPGVDIVSTHIGPTGYATADGTSFAAPVVSAGAALLLGSGYAPGAVRERFAATARPVGAGLGRIDLAAAVGLTPLPAVEAPPAPAPSPSPVEASGLPSPQPVAEVEEVAPVTPPAQLPTPSPVPASPSPPSRPSATPLPTVPAVTAVLPAPAPAPPPPFARSNRPSLLTAAAGVLVAGNLLALAVTLRRKR